MTTRDDATKCTNCGHTAKFGLTTCCRHPDTTPQPGWVERFTDEQWTYFRAGEIKATADERERIIKLAYEILPPLLEFDEFKAAIRDGRVPAIREGE